MAQNHVQEGKVIDWSNGTGSDVLSGEVVVIGEFVGVALGNIADGETGRVAIEEVFALPCNSALDIAQGDRLYWDVADGELNKTDAENHDAGVAFTAAGAGVTSVNVKLNA